MSDLAGKERECRLMDLVSNVVLELTCSSRRNQVSPHSVRLVHSKLSVLAERKLDHCQATGEITT